ncbi:LCP family protein [Lactococcus sp.]|uniref:LCP family protein n=1 Tax=Lactococcus sp. TaxID=44273 RepID=UPI0035ADC4F7
MENNENEPHYARANRHHVAKAQPRQKIKKKHHLLRNLMIVFALVLVSAGGFLVYAYGNVQKSLSKTYVNTGTSGSSPQVIQATKPLTILLMGVDTGDTTRGGAGSWDGNSDSQIIMTLNPKTDTTTIVSMERDTMTNIEDTSGTIKSTQKMNAAYPAGYNAGGLTTAVQYAMKTIGNQAGIPLSNFVTVNMDGLINLVNDVGGVEVVNDTNGQDVYQNTVSGNITLPVTHQIVKSGAIYISNTEPSYTSFVPYIQGNPEQLVNGNQALVFARDRDTLANGDYGRAAHQREVMTQLVKKMLSINNALKYQKFLNDISSDFKTNISSNLSNLQALLAYRNCFKKIVSIQYQGVGATAEGESYQFIPENVDLAVQNAMKLAAGDATETTLASDMITYESYFGMKPNQYYMPSATVTVSGKSPVVYGLDTTGQLVAITSSNASQFVSTTGSAVSASAASSSTLTSSVVNSTGLSGSTTSSSSTTTTTNASSDTTGSNLSTGLPQGLTTTGTTGVYKSPKGYTVLYKNGYYVYAMDGKLYPNDSKYPGQ